MNKSFNINDAISLGNSVIGIFPKIIALAWFAAIVVLAVRLIKSRGNLSTLELAAVVAALGLGMK